MAGFYAARQRQRSRYADIPGVSVNADAEGELLEAIARPDDEGRTFLQAAAEKFAFSARAYHRVMRVARTIADLEGDETVGRNAIAEAVGLRTGMRPV